MIVSTLFLYECIFYQDKNGKNAYFIKIFYACMHILLKMYNFVLYYRKGGVEMYRKMEEKLYQWKQQNKKKPLLIKGARQVGNNVKLEIM